MAQKKHIIVDHKGVAKYIALPQLNNFMEGMGIMQFNQITKQAIDFQKTTFTNWYDAVAMLQDQATSTMESMLNQTNLVPEEGRKAIKSWASACQDERNRFKIYMEAGFDGLEKHFVKKIKRTPAKTEEKE